MNVVQQDIPQRRSGPGELMATGLKNQNFARSISPFHIESCKIGACKLQTLQHAAS